MMDSKFCSRYNSVCVTRMEEDTHAELSRAAVVNINLGKLGGGPALDGRRLSRRSR